MESLSINESGRVRSNSAADLAHLRRSIDAMIGLALEGNHLCRLIAKHGGVRAVLTIAVDPSLRAVRVAALRALGTVCCVLEGIMELEDSGGIEVLSDTLRDPGATEEEKSEAAGLLAQVGALRDSNQVHDQLHRYLSSCPQVTSPWIENNSSIESLSRHLSHLIESLTST